MTPNPVGQEGQGLAGPGCTVSVSELPDPGAGILPACPHRMGGGPAAAQSLPRSQEPPRGVGGGTHPRQAPRLTAQGRRDGAGDGLDAGGTAGAPGHRRGEACQTQVHAFWAALRGAGGAPNSPGASHCG